MLPSVNEENKDCISEEAIAQIKSVLPRPIEALVRAGEQEGTVLLVKVVLKGGFRRVMCKQVKE